jgi:hypothetical protein
LPPGTSRIANGQRVSRSFDRTGVVVAGDGRRDALFSETGSDAGEASLFIEGVGAGLISAGIERGRDTELKEEENDADARLTRRQGDDCPLRLQTWRAAHTSR